MPNLHALIEAGDLDGLAAALSGQADVDVPGHCGATPLMTALKRKDRAAFDLLLAHGADPDRTDDFNHTALHAAVRYDWVEAVARLVELGMDLGLHPKYPLKEVDHQTTQCTIEVPMPEELAGVMDEQTWRSLLSAPPDQPLPRRPEAVIEEVQSVEVLQVLLDAGEPLEDAPTDIRRLYIGLPDEAPLEVSRKAYIKDRRPRFGRSNPERVSSEFLRAMIRCGGPAYVARKKFADEEHPGPVWCYDRFGHSLTPLPDGRFIGIAGEHEDWYDEDFSIYNDVVVHDGRGGIEIFMYPRKVFPPTDFHTATLIDRSILIIGTLGYPDDRRAGVTPVHRLDLDTMRISPIGTDGECPGWISSHRAKLDAAANAIRLHRGQIWSDPDRDLIANDDAFVLQLDSFTWKRCL